MLIAAALIGGAYAGCCRQRERTPDYALVQIARAVQTEDRALFEQYVDTEAVLSLRTISTHSMSGIRRIGSSATMPLSCAPIWRSGARRTSLLRA